jgi:hypothetical protein
MTLMTSTCVSMTPIDCRAEREDGRVSGMTLMLCVYDACDACLCVYDAY